jgi:hypothetical protein
MSNTRPRTPCPIRVVVRDEANPDAPPVHDRTGDHNDRYFREWIVDTEWWALRNNHSTHKYPA